MNICDNIKNILSKPKKEITKDDILYMYDNCFKNFEYIKKLVETEYYGKMLVTQILTCLSIKEFGNKEPVFKLGT